MSRLLWVLLLLCQGTGWAAVRSVEIDNPRAFGHVIGDVLTQTVRITLDDPWELDERTLPKSEELNIWVNRTVLPLQTRPVADGMRYELTLNYQIFNVSDKPQPVIISPHGLVARHGQEMVRIFIPEQVLTVSPVTQTGRAQSLDYINIQPAEKPLAMDQFTPRRNFWLAWIPALLALLGLAYIWIGLPWLQRANGPFARALRQLRAMPRNLSDDSSYRTALRIVHKALNSTSGKVLVAADLPVFIEQHPGFQRQQQALLQLFAASDSQFFQRSEQPVRLTTAQLQALCKFGRDVERGLV